MKKLLAAILITLLVVSTGGCQSRQAIQSNDISKKSGSVTPDNTSGILDNSKAEGTSTAQKIDENSNKDTNGLISIENTPNIPCIKSCTKLLSNSTLYDYSDETNSILYSNIVEDSNIGGYKDYGKELYIMDLNNMGTQKVTDMNPINQDNYSSFTALFSPSSKMISAESSYGYFVEDEDCPTYSYLIENSNGYKKKLISSKETYYPLQWQNADSYILHCGGYVYKVISADGTIIKEIKNASEVVAHDENLFFLTPDGKLLASKSDSTAPYLKIAEDIVRFSLSPDGKKIAYAVGQNSGEKRIKIIEIGKYFSINEVLLDIKACDNIDPLLWSPDSRYLFTQYGINDNWNCIIADSNNRSFQTKSGHIRECYWLPASKYLITDDWKLICADSFEIGSISVPFDGDMSCSISKLIRVDSNNLLIQDSINRIYKVALGNQQEEIKKRILENKFFEIPFSGTSNEEGHINYDFNSDGKIETLKYNTVSIKDPDLSHSDEILKLKVSYNGQSIERMYSGYDTASAGLSSIGVLDINTSDRCIDFYIGEGQLADRFSYVLYRLTDKGIKELGSFQGKMQALSGDGKIYFWGGNLYEIYGNKDFDTNLVLEYYDVDKKDYVKTRQIEGKTIISDRKIRVYKKKEDVISGAPLEEAEIAKRSEGKMVKIINPNEKFKVLYVENTDLIQICTEDGKSGWIGGFHMVWD